MRERFRSVSLKKKLFFRLPTEAVMLMKVSGCHDTDITDISRTVYYNDFEFHVDRRVVSQFMNHFLFEVSW